LGYDIWIGNIRGNRYSLGHTHLNSDDVKGSYWHFTYDEMAKHDLPAMLNYVKEITKAPKIKFVCHSQGCTILVALGALDPQYVQSIVNTTVAFAPAVYLQHHNSLAIMLTRWTHFVNIYLSTGLKIFLSGDVWYIMLKYIGYLFPRMFMAVLYLVVGPVHKMSMALDRVPVIAAHLPGGTSAYNMVHFIQASQTSVFQMFDFGKEGNLKHYRTEKPPPYKMSNWQNINMKWRIVYGEKDAFIPKPGIMELVKHIDRNGNVEIQGLEDASHFDVFTARYASKLIYPQVINFLERNNNS
jgi:lysosomal acid lipase/cholesteryl ester hydrolase